MQKTYPLVLSVSLIFFFASCAGVKFDAGGGDLTADLAKLQRQLLVKPDDPVLLRDLGVVYFQMQRYEYARVNLQRSYLQSGNDPRTIFYYGMALEYLNEIDAALAVYIKYTDVSSQYRKFIEGRYRALTQQIVKLQFQTLIADEQKLGAEKIVPKAVAVFPLTYQGTDPKYDALGKGLSEMMLIDLGQVKSLQVIERIRIQTLLDELQFGQSSMVDQPTAPRLGKLLSAGKIVSGAFNVSNYNLRADVGTWDIVNKKFPPLTTKSDALDNIFKMEKELVFSIVKDLGITLTAQEREKIEFIPTKNTFAFITYCLGLKSEDARDYRAARVYYNQAATLDPNFGLAKTRLSAAEALSTAGGSKEDALVAAEQMESGGKRDKQKSSSNLILDRLMNLGYGIGSTFRPGQDDRHPAGESTEVFFLPEPPSPPNR